MFKKDTFREQKNKPFKIILMVLVFIGFFSLASAVVMLLWNAILPDVVGVKRLSFLKAAGLLLLSKILFGGFRKGGYWRSKKKKQWKEKWMNMSDEERMEAKSRWKNHCKTRNADVAKNPDMD